ncbi:MAG: serine/threonine protein kinase, partial [Planctomycetes bacterium]|nr:serine/threonine protein kinase [Planctomycetota bacterium]
MEGTVVGNCRILRRLGAGGMGSVWLAAGPGDGPVAVKLMHPHVLAQPGFLDRFRREAEIGARVHHENVVRTLFAGEQEVAGRTLHYIVMEYVEGDTLRALLADLGFLPENLLREIARQVAAGLAAIHAEGAVHRDLKPENVLITREDRVRIMDLGVAHFFDRSSVLTGAE